MKHLIDSLVFVKIEFFKDIVYVLQTYLIQFQSDAPLFPFINNELVQLCTKIKQFFMKRNVLKEASSDFKLINIDVTRKENSMGSAAIKLHTTTSNLLLKSSCFKEKKIKFLVLSYL